MNVVFKLQCPQCGEENRLRIHANTWVKLSDDGKTTVMGKSKSHYWDKNSNAECTLCAHEDKVAEFCVITSHG